MTILTVNINEQNCNKYWKYNKAERAINTARTNNKADFSNKQQFKCNKTRQLLSVKYSLTQLLQLLLQHKLRLQRRNDNKS